MQAKMLKKKNVSRLFYVLFSILIVFSPLLANNQVQKNYPEFERLTEKAINEGMVRLIIKLNVPMIKELTAVANQFCSPDPGKESVWGGKQADSDLMDSITAVAQEVLLELKGNTYEVNHIYKSIPYMALQVSAEALAILQVLPKVLGIEEDVPQKLIDPVMDNGQSKGDNPPANNDNLDLPLLDTSVNLIGASAAWSMGYTGSGRYVAILDTGIRKTHEFFQGKTIVEACYASGSDGTGPVGDCPNGLISQTGSGSAVHYSSTYSTYDHGTHVAGIAAGNYGTLFGVAKDANIIAVKIFSMFPASSCSGGTPCVMSWNSDCLAGLDYVYSIRGSYSIDAVNLSLGGGSYSSACDTDSRKAVIDNLRAVGIASVIATGNNGYCGYVSSPACISTSVAVGASTDADLESSFNNWHASMQRLFAPGSSIYSATGASDSSYASWNGTSMATPHVAGAWALIKQAKSSATVTEILSALQSTGVPVTSSCDGYTAPISRIQVNSAITSLSGCTKNAKDDLVGSWNGQGVYYRSSDTGAFYQLATPATLITMGDMDNDCIDDLIGIWPGQGGVWIEYSKTGTWTLLASTARHIATGDMNGDGKPELLGTWDGQGVFWRNNSTGAWNQLATPATLITSGDLDNDGTDDLIGIWPSQGGVWVRYSQSGSWSQLASTAIDISTGDMNGDGQQELLATWNGQGVYYRVNATGAWVQLATPATQVTSGDLDGDGTDDVIGIWPAQSGVYVKYSNGTWVNLASTATDIAAGKMRPNGSTLAIEQKEETLAVAANFKAGPVIGPDTLDLSAVAPGGVSFICSKAENLEPYELEDDQLQRVPGPGEAGFHCTEQENLEPRGNSKSRENPNLKK